MKNAIKYDAIIIGFGKGGKTLAGAIGEAGKKVALIEQSSRMYGGTCINVGCIPTKSLVHRANQVALQSGSFAEKAAAYKAAMEQKDALTGMLREKNYQKLNLHSNITVIDGIARFLSSHVIEVQQGNQKIHVEAQQIFINTGSEAFIPPIAGLENNPYVYTSETLLDLKELPSSLVIIGGGYIGVEFSSIYASFGTKVTILQDGEEFLPREDKEIAEAVRKSLEQRGIEVLTGIKVKAIHREANRADVEIEKLGENKKIPAQAVLIATGRKPNTANLNLAAAGVEIDSRGGIKTDDSLMTSVPHIYAMGDVRGGLQFTYISLDDYRIVRSQVLGDGKYTLRKRGAVPYSVFLNPPFSRVGLSEKEALAAGYDVKVAHLNAVAIPKAHVLEQSAGLLKAVIDAKSGLILGAHLFCEESYEMINLVKLAMDAQLPYTVLRDTIYTHPTMSEAFNDLFAL